jgi:hypothetical protein
VTTHPECTVLDPETYQTVPIHNKAMLPKELVPGAKVHIITDGVTHFFVREVS